MKIAISGTTGFIGKNLVEYFSNETVCSITRGQDPFSSLNIFQPDLIIHSAAEIYDSDAMFDSNVLLTKNYLDWLKQNPSAQMIYLGSSSEYGPVSRMSSENDKINPIDMYQATKGIGTILCQGYARTYDLDIKIVRPYSVYGKYEKPHRLFPRLWKAFMLEQPMTLHDGYHDFIYINDFIKGIELIYKSQSAPKGDIINLGSGIQYSNFEVLHAFNRITGKTAPVTEVCIKAKTFETDIWCCDNSYALEKYGFSCEYDLESGIRDFLKTAHYNREER
jgi:nucleoside-diphosphate-sugar epimerase